VSAKARRFCSAGEERPRPRQIKPLRFDRLASAAKTVASRRVVLAGRVEAANGVCNRARIA
jgi:hypothetical protein